MDFNKCNEPVTKTIDKLAKDVVKYLKEQSLTLSAAESCTGGMFSASITDVPGASEIFAGAAVTYTEQMKMQLLGVKEETLRGYTVYSPQTACEMAQGVRELMHTDIGLGITGIAGPDGGTEKMPVGTVFIAVSCPQKCISKELRFYGAEEYQNLDRKGIRELTVQNSLQFISETLQNIERIGN